MGRIIVGMDGSECAAVALRWAVEEGERRDWPVTALLAWSYLRQYHPDRRDAVETEYDEGFAAAALDAYVVDVLGAEAAGAVGREVAYDEPDVALVEAAEDASLLVVGSHGYGGIRGVVMGSVSQRCLHHSTVPVAVVRDNGDSAEVVEGKVVVGVDGSSTSMAALQWAVDEARSRNGYVEVVHSWLLPAAFGYPTLAMPDPALHESAAEDLVSRMLESVDVSGLSRPVSRVIIGGESTAGLIAARAENAELVVVGSRGVGGFRGMLIGSVAHQLAHHAPCPLVVLPAVDSSV